MKKLKHSKYKNTGLLAEFLVRQISKEIALGEDAKALSIASKYIKPGSELAKELKLYNMLTNSKVVKESKAEDIVKVAIAERIQINEEVLNKEKFKLVRDIKATYGDNDDFFKQKVDNYKEYASVYKLFTGAVSNTEDLDLLESVNCKHTIIDGMLNRKKPTVLSDLQEYKEVATKLDESIKSLDVRQANIINSIRVYGINSNEFISCIKESIDELISDNTTCLKACKEKSAKSILQESSSIIKSLSNKSSYTIEDVTKILKGFEITNEIKKNIL